MKFGDVLKAELDRAGMTAYRLGQLTGTSQSGISRILSGETEPSWGTVQKICKVLGLPCTTFQSAEVELPEPSEERGRGRPKQSAESDESQPLPDAKVTPAAGGAKPAKKAAGQGKKPPKS